MIESEQTKGRDENKDTQAAEPAVGRAAAEHGVRGGAGMERSDRCRAVVRTRGIRGGLGRADADASAVYGRAGNAE